MITLHCTTCGSQDIVADATADWDPVEEQWTLCGIMDTRYCSYCNDECRVEERVEGFDVEVAE